MQTTEGNMSPMPISFYQYHPDDSSWRPLGSYPAITYPILDLRMVTWNIWFDEVQKQNRFLGVLNELLAVTLLDIVSLQEVTPQVVEWLQNSIEIRTDWLLTNCWDTDHQREV